jgi:hypothetical protein
VTKPIQIEARAHSKASPASVFAVAADSSGYPRWSRIGSFEAVRPGEGGPYGVGSRRIFRTPPIKLLEEVVELVPDRLVAYSVVSGLPFRGYRADIELTPAADGGTDIWWRNAFETTIPGTRWFWRAFMQGVFDEMTPQLAREAERVEGLG